MTVASSRIEGLPGRVTEKQWAEASRILTVYNGVAGWTAEPITGGEKCGLIARDNKRQTVSTGKVFIMLLIQTRYTEN